MILTNVFAIWPSKWWINSLQWRKRKIWSVLNWQNSNSLWKRLLQSFSKRPSILTKRNQLKCQYSIWARSFLKRRHISSRLMSVRSPQVQSSSTRNRKRLFPSPVTQITCSFLVSNTSKFWKRWHRNSRKFPTSGKRYSWLVSNYEPICKRVKPNKRQWRTS